jgi:outer membrane protein assembly factor BamA
MSSFTYENHRYIRVEVEFDGAIGSGAQDSTTVLTDIPTINKDEYISEVFYRVVQDSGAAILNSSATIYLQAGISTDDVDAALNSTTGVLDTMNTNGFTGGGYKPPHFYTKSIIDGRTLLLVPKLGDITSGIVELTLTIARNNIVIEDATSFYSAPDKE